MTEAVCVPVPATTAYVSLGPGGFPPRKRALVAGAVGAAGRYPCQPAPAGGTKVNAAIRRDEQVSQASCHGDTDVWVTEGVAAFVGDGRRFGVVADIVGAGIADQIQTVLKPGGTYVVASAEGGRNLIAPIPGMLFGCWCLECNSRWKSCGDIRDTQPPLPLKSVRKRPYDRSQPWGAKRRAELRRLFSVRGC